MTVATLLSSWRRPRPKAASPKPTSVDRQAAIDRLAEIDGQRGEVLTLQATADELRGERDDARESFNAAQADYASAQSRASGLGASLDSQSRRQHAILRRTSSPLIQEFIETVTALLRDVRNEGILKSAPLSGKFSLDGHADRQGWSTYASAGARATALIDAQRTAEDLKMKPLTEEQVEQRLNELYASLPAVTYEHC